MCNFFSFDSDGMGKTYYFDWKLRKSVLSGKLKKYEPDSHTSIADYFGFKAAREDLLNRYEYNPLTQVFKVDKLNVQDDSFIVEGWVKKLNFKKIVEPLIIKSTINPLMMDLPKVTSKDIVLLKKWASVGASVGASVWGSVWDSVWAYISSFFDIKYKYDLSPGVKLWERGIVPSFDGTVWRLHSGENADIIYSVDVKDL